MFLTRDDTELLVFLAAGPGSACSLDSSPKKNWVERSGGLPNYICRIARALVRSGKDKSTAISIAVTTVKKWAAGGKNVNADTRARAAKAVAEWEALRARNAAGKVIKASRHDESLYVMLSNIPAFNTDIVRTAWDQVQRAARMKEQQARADGAELGDSYEPQAYTYSYIRELWTDHILVEIDGPSFGIDFASIPYEVDAHGNVVFGTPVEVVQQWAPANAENDPDFNDPDDDGDDDSSAAGDTDGDLTDHEYGLLAEHLGLSAFQGGLFKLTSR